MSDVKVNLPKTQLGMKANLPVMEPELLKLWSDIGLYEQQRSQSLEKEKFVLHDGPPYANGNIHIGTALNKILKDIVIRYQQLLGKNAVYVPGWDCHGLPIEWKIEEEYKKKEKTKKIFRLLSLEKSVEILLHLGLLRKKNNLKDWVWREIGKTLT